MTIDYIHRFSQLRASQPHLTDSQLLNSNNHSPFSSTADVTVAGGGILGLCYAIHLKNISPHLKIAIYEKSPAPVQKIGESTLATFSRFINGDVLPVDYLFRLFGLKDGLKWYCIDREGGEVTSEDIGGLVLSFQLDRRLSELFLTMWAQEMGINVYHGVGVEFDTTVGDENTSSVASGAGQEKKRPFTPPRMTLKRFPETSDTEIQTKFICDATGFSRKLTGKYGPKKLFKGWNCDAYWAYFKQKKGGKAESRLDHWDYPATQHLCFPEGWGWFINLISWHHAPLANLMDLVGYMISQAKNKTPVHQIPYTRELSSMFDCPFEHITSIGWAVRDDHKFPANMDEYGKTDAEQKFMYFQRRYPTLNRLMNDVYELLPKYYGNRTYFVRKSMAYQSPVVAGNGWFAIGNSTGFTNPFLSPGINAGMGSAFLAATLTKEVLDAPLEESATVMKKCANQYHGYVHDTVLPRLDTMNRFWYNIFRNHRVFEALVKCYLSLGVNGIGKFRIESFSAPDLNWMVGAGTDDCQEFCKQVLEILDAPDGVAVSEEKVEKLLALGEEWRVRRTEQFPDNKWGSHFRKYDHKMRRVLGKSEREVGGNCLIVRCKECNVWRHDGMETCPICGTEEALVPYALLAPRIPAVASF